MREKRKDPEWVKANNEKRRNDPELKEYLRLHQEQRRRKAGGKSLDAVRAKNKQSFFTKAAEVHGARYDYSLVEYIDGRTKVNIICGDHGPFSQTPKAHLGGQGCPTCASTARAARSSNQRDVAAQTFTIKATAVHGSLYDYSKSVYVNIHTKLEIICRDHGSFWQIPAAHLQGQGCPHCANDRRAAFAESKGEMAITTWLDVNEIRYEKQKMFEGCVDALPLRFDFYVPSLNLVIEFDGAQHFEFVKKFHGTEEGFERCKRRDAIKNQYTEDHNIELLRIKYSEEKQIEKILSERILLGIKKGEVL